MFKLFFGYIGGIWLFIFITIYVYIDFVLFLDFVVLFDAREGYKGPVN